MEMHQPTGRKNGDETLPSKASECQAVVALALCFAWLQESSFSSMSSTLFQPVIARQSFDGAETGSYS